MTEEQLVKIADIMYFKAGHKLRAYGAFHLVWLFLTIAGMVAAVYYTLKKPQKALHFLYIISSVVMWIGELYKQFVYSFVKGKFVYDWYSFPFQFCSTPLYTFLLCAILKKGKLYDAVSVYNATYGLFAGTMVMLFPSSVLSYSYAIGTQSLLHHALMMTVGVSALVEYAKKLNVKLFCESIGVFAALLLIAEILNFGLPVWTGQEVNMYFISKTYSGDNPLKVFQQAYPYPLFVAVYFAIFTEVACGMAFAAYKAAKGK